jgi:septum formation protein
MSDAPVPGGGGLWLRPEPLVLASRSRVRGAMLAAAAIPFEAVPADIDERAVEDRLDGGEPVAASLACAKARAVAASRPGRLVLGSDQTIRLDGEALHKPADTDDAARQLRRMAGRAHVLESAAVLVQDGAVLGSVTASATIRIRPLSDAMIALYLAAAGESVLGSIGVYEVEALGVHLFEAVEGDHYTIMGLPLLPVLDLLRRQRALAA